MGHRLYAVRMSAQIQPHSHRHDAREYLATVERACRERGLRLTESRREILQLLAAQGRPAKAYDLLESLRQLHATAAPPTVYRALEFLLAHGFIHRLDSINAFVTCHHPEQAHQVPFLICDECNQAEELCDDGHMAALIAREAQRRGFAPRAQTIEVHGLCARCRARR
jgi:Fur family zinc uptake transcriptional regulator